LCGRPKASGGDSWWSPVVMGGGGGGLGFGRERKGVKIMFFRNDGLA